MGQEPCSAAHFKSLLIGAIMTDTRVAQYMTTPRYIATFCTASVMVTRNSLPALIGMPISLCRA